MWEITSFSKKWTSNYGADASGLPQSVGGREGKVLIAPVPKENKSWEKLASLPNIKCFPCLQSSKCKLMLQQPFLVLEISVLHLLLESESPFIRSKLHLLVLYFNLGQPDFIQTLCKFGKRLITADQFECTINTRAFTSCLAVESLTQGCAHFLECHSSMLFNSSTWSQMCFGWHWLEAFNRGGASIVIILSLASSMKSTWIGTPSYLVIFFKSKVYLHISSGSFNYAQQAWVLNLILYFVHRPLFLTGVAIIIQQEQKSLGLGF